MADTGNARIYGTAAPFGAQPVHLPSPVRFLLLSQFAVFCVVGVANTVVDMGVYYALTRAVWTIELFSAAKAVSYLVATVFSFTANRYVTFGRRGRPRFVEIRRFYSTVALGIFINVGVQYAAVEFLGVHDLTAALLSAGATALWGFAFSKWYVFKK